MRVIVVAQVWLLQLRQWRREERHLSRGVVRSERLAGRRSGAGHALAVARGFRAR